MTLHWIRTFVTTLGHKSRGVIESQADPYRLTRAHGEPFETKGTFLRPGAGR